MFKNESPNVDTLNDDEISKRDVDDKISEQYRLIRLGALLGAGFTFTRTGFMSPEGTNFETETKRIFDLIDSATYITDDGAVTIKHN